MSSYAASTIISLYNFAYTGNYCTVAAVALAVYAWLDSLGDEITLVWSPKRKRMCANMVYALTRYATLVAYAVSIVPLGELPLMRYVATLVTLGVIWAHAKPASCEAVFWLQVVFTAASNVAAAAFSGLRIYALSKSNKYLASLIFLLSLAPCIVDTVFNSKWIDIAEWPSPFYCVKQSTASVELTFRCTIYTPSLSQRRYSDVVLPLVVTTAARICAIVADLLVAVATWWNAYRATHAHKLAFGPSLGQVMLYEGSVYFIVLASLNILRIVFSALAMNNVFSAAGDLPIFTDLLGSIIISRFILDLRKVHQGTNTPLSSLSFVELNFGDHSTSDSIPRFLETLSGPTCTAAEARSVTDLGAGRRPERGSLQR